MRFVSLVFLSLLVTLLALPTSLASSYEARERAKKAAAVFQAIMSAEDQAVPQVLLDRARCVAVFPSVKKGGFVVGAQYGKGVISCRKPGSSWGAPAFLTIGGGSFGLQIGGQAVDLVLLIMNDGGVESLLKDKFEIGAGAAVSGGPVGRNASASTDVLMQAQILSYSRSRGIFAGLELKGSVIKPDEQANQDIYNAPLTPRDIIVEGKATTPKTIENFPQMLGKFSATLKK
jgi:lipid-binding SYLF domain-containing protein